MPPQQSHPAGQQYDFIMNAGQSPKKGLFSGSSKQVKIVLFLCLVTAAIIVIGILLSSLLSRGSVRRDKLTSLAQTQTEIVRVATLGQTKAKGKDALSLASVVNLSVTSQLNQTLDFLKNNSQRPNDKTLAAGKDAETDATLTAAEQSNRYDTTLTQVLNDSLKTYRQTVADNFNSASNANEKAFLQDLYDQISPLVSD